MPGSAGGDNASPLDSSMGAMQQGPPQLQGDPAAAAAERNKVVMGQVRDLHQMVDGLARQYPGASQEADAVKQALVALMNKIVASPPGREATQQTGVMG